MVVVRGRLLHLSKMWRVRSARLPLWLYEDSRLRSFARLLLLFLGVIFLASAIVLIFSGCFVILFCKNYRYFFQEFFFPLPGWLAVVTALILIPTGILAILVFARNSCYHQGTLMYLLIVLLCLQVSLTVLTQFYSTWMAVELKSTMGQAFNQYNGTHSLARGSGTVDMLQEKLQCCGLRNYTDWLNASAAFWHFPSEKSHVPRSCCKKHEDCGSDLNQPDQLFQEGCLRKLQDQIHYRMSFLFFCCVVLSVLELLAGASNGILMSSVPLYDIGFLDSSVFS
ncbi:tetraspanin-3-like [Coturnix japonica]|uniref:tetraspanin-3-like n=1 Tax=Coturnix japonica TaxID=93934 RepID=UPI0007774841|nr:tetraspanin-3-like [Coturnix japonica]